jgi:hypothetical protein
MIVSLGYITIYLIFKKNPENEGKKKGVGGKPAR